MKKGMVILTVVVLAAIGLFVYIALGSESPKEELAKPIQVTEPTDYSAGYEKYSPEETDRFIEGNFEDIESAAEEYQYDENGQTVIIYR